MIIRRIRMFERRPTAGEMKMVIDDLSDKTRALGYNSYIFRVNSTRIDVKDVRLMQSYIDKFGYNRSPYTERRGRILNWENWTVFIDTINDVLDAYAVSANVSSQHDLIKIRAGDERRTAYQIETDLWEWAAGKRDPFMRRTMWIDNLVNGWSAETHHSLEELKEGV